MGLIFKPHLIKQIVEGNKTQTRRPVKVGDTEVLTELMPNEWRFDAVLRGKKQIRWHYVDAERSVVWGRGKPAVVWCKADKTFYMPHSKNEQAQFLDAGYEVLRIRITKIRRENVRMISLADSVAEGFEDQLGFVRVWTNFYDSAGAGLVLAYDHGGNITHSVETLFVALMDRPHDLYDGWALDFEVV